MVGWRRLLSGAAPEHSVALRVWTLAAVITSVLAVTAHDDFFGLRLAVTALVTAGYAVSYWRRSQRNWWVKILLAALCLRVGWQFLQDVLADPYHTSIPLTVFLLWLQVLHSFDLPARRDLLFSLLASVILMAVAAVFARDLTYLIYLAGYAVAAVQALVYNAWQGAQQDVAPRAPDAPSGVAGIATHLLIAVMLCGSVIFVLTPRFEGLRLTTLPFSPRLTWLGLLSGRLLNPAYPGEGGEETLRWNPRGYFGFSPTVDLRLRGRLDHSLVLRVRATRELNWRALVFDTYTGTGWRMSDPTTSQVDAGSPPLTLIHQQDEVLSYSARPLQVVQTFFIEQEQPNVIFAAPLAERLYVATDRVYMDRYGAIRLPGTLKPGTVYSVVSRVLVPEPDRLRQASGEIPRGIRDRYLALPRLPQRVHALAQSLTSGQPTLYDRVIAVNRHLWTAYRYDLTIPPQRRSGDAVDYFLFEERRGYCEQFASAMVVLLRSAGIPSRLVTGYAPGTLNRLTGLLEVRNSDAHAWVEVFFPGVGWVEFEPTPGFPDTADLGSPVVTRWIWQDFASRLVANIEALAARSPWLSAVRRAGEGGRVGAWGVLLLAATLGAVGVLRAAGGRASPQPPRAALQEIYEEICGLLARRGLRRHPSETVAEYSRRLEARHRFPELGAVSDLVQAAVYGGREPDPGMLATARRHLLDLRRRLRARRGSAR